MPVPGGDGVVGTNQPVIFAKPLRCLLHMDRPVVEPHLTRENNLSVLRYIEVRAVDF